MSLLISILAYNQPEITDQCIEHLIANTAGSDYFIHVWDNGSKRETYASLEKWRGHKRILDIFHSDRNIGFIKANNAVFCGLAGDFDYFCVLNNDLLVEERDWSDRLIRAMNDNGWSAAGARQKFELDQNFWGVPRSREEIDYVDGSLLMVRVKDLAFLPTLFDEKYLHHIFCEDSDLCLRLQERGLKIGEVDLQIEHKHQATCKNEKIRVDLPAARDHNLMMATERWSISRNEHRPMKILVRRSHAIGDVLCIEPVIRELHYKYPGADITVETSYPEILKYSGNKITLATSPTKLKYDQTIELFPSYELHPTMHMVDAYAQAAGVVLKLGEKIPRFDPTLKRTPGRKFKIMFCAEGGWPSRTWPVNEWKKVLSEIKSDGIAIDEVGFNKSLYTGIGRNLIGHFDGRIHDLAELMGECDLFIGQDCGLMHLAQAVDLPIMAVFGCTYPGVRVHDWSRAKVVWLDQEQLPCAGCHHLRPAPNACTECDKLYCLDRITDKMVLDCYYNQPFGNKPDFHVREWKGVSECSPSC